MPTERAEQAARKDIVRTRTSCTKIDACRIFPGLVSAETPPHAVVIPRNTESVASTCIGSASGDIEEAAHARGFAWLEGSSAVSSTIGIEASASHPRDQERTNDGEIW